MLTTEKTLMKRIEILIDKYGRGIKMLTKANRMDLT